MNEHLDHLAVQANINSMKFAMAKDKDAWLALFADDAVVRDPVGKSPFDPEGEGHRGKEKISNFWDNIMAPANIELTPIKRFPSGDLHCAVVIEGVNDMGGAKIDINMTVVYEVNAEGKILALSAYWSWADMEKQFAALG